MSDHASFEEQASNEGLTLVRSAVGGKCGRRWKNFALGWGNGLESGVGSCAHVNACRAAFWPHAQSRERRDVAVVCACHDLCAQNQLDE